MLACSSPHSRTLPSSAQEKKAKYQKCPKSFAVVLSRAKPSANLEIGMYMHMHMHMYLYLDMNMYMYMHLYMYVYDPKVP